MTYPIITIKNNKTAPLKRRHPWVFSGALKTKPMDLKEGDIVKVQSEAGEILGFGHYQNSSISIRMLSFNKIPIDQSFWNAQIANAKHLRHQLGLTLSGASTNCYRLVHGEGDGLPGLIIDIYEKNAVIQCHSIGMYHSLPTIAQAIESNFPEGLDTIYHKNVLSNDHSLTGYEDKFLKGTQTQCLIKENECLFEVNWKEGQKTGFFIDQRENRQFLSTLAKDKSVLNAFSYTGGFSIYALKGGARKVDSVDISGKAIELVNRNVTLNGMDEAIHQSFQSDVLSYLQSCDPYDLVIVDPPAYAKNQKKKHNAIQGYKRLNKLAIEKVKPQGLMATFSCSQVVDEVLFYHTITAAALEANRPIRVIKKFTQGPDHPVNIFHPEGSYLKGLLLYID